MNIIDKGYDELILNIKVKLLFVPVILLKILFFRGYLFFMAIAIETTTIKDSDISFNRKQSD